MDGHLFSNAKNVAMKTSFYTAFQLKLGIMPIYIFKLVLRSCYHFDKINKDPYIHVTGTG